MFDTLPGPMAHAKTGKLRVLAVTGTMRLAVLPPAIAARLNTEVSAILAEVPVQAMFAAWGIQPSGGSAESFGVWIAQESARWRDFVIRNKIEQE